MQSTTRQTTPFVTFGPYERALVPVANGAAAVRDARGRVLAAQTVPAMPFDLTEAAEVTLALADLQAGETLAFAPTTEPPPLGTPITVTPEGDALVIRNGRRSVRVPATGLLDQPFPGPVMAMRLDDGPWSGDSLLVDTPQRGYVETVVEALGPCCVQWHTIYRWGNDACLLVRARWAAESDTIQVEEVATEDSEAAVEWRPFAGAESKAWCRGFRGRPMDELAFTPTPGARRGQGRRRLQCLSHISYFNQWNLAWAGFTADNGRFVGLFTGWGSLWERRGHLRPEVYEVDGGGHLVRFPVKQGRRLYGLVIAARAEANMDGQSVACLLNLRKTQLADLSPAKVRHWELQPPLEAQTPHLMRADDLQAFRARLAADPLIPAALDNLAEQGPSTAAAFSLAYWRQDREAMRRETQPMLDYATKTLDEIGLGGYERLGIFEGRTVKHHAFTLDLLWHEGLISEADYRTLRRVYLALAYMYADPDYTIYADFWAHRDPESGMVEALKNDMGDCPVPPNFASEFYTTTGVMAELFPSHPQCATWRRWTQEQNDLFLETYYEPDGTYRESLNYHTHGFNELLCYFYPAFINGTRDYFADPRVRGSFAHFVQIQTPPLAEATNPLQGAALYDDWKRWVVMLPGWQAPRRALLPANGNSGAEGLEQEHGGELALGMSLYRERDPQFAGELAHAWRQAGMPMLDHVHPLLSLVTTDPTVPAQASAAVSLQRQSLGVVSRAALADGTPVYSLFRAGDCTHHMDYDQGSLHLMYGDRVLIGEYGYHCHGPQETNLSCFETWLHSTVVYAEDKHLSSGYTGLERAPNPALVHLSEQFDWAVHRIVNTNYRDATRFWYNVQLPTPTTVHVRHYLFVKPDYFLIWDTFAAAHNPSLFFLHPRQPLRQEGPGLFRAGQVGEPHLRVQFLLPREPEVVESEQSGPLWSLALRNAPGQPYLTLLVPQISERNITATLDADDRTLRVTGQGVSDTIILPPPGSTEVLPEVRRG